MPFSTKKCSVLKQHKKGSTISSPPSGTYTKKPNQSCKYWPHRPAKSSTPSSSRSSSNSSISSTKGLLKKNNVPKQVKSSTKLKKTL